MHLVRLEHIAVGRAVDRFEEISDGAHVQHEEQRGIWNHLALLCPEGIVCECSPGYVSNQYQLRVGWERPALSCCL